MMIYHLLNVINIYLKGCFLLQSSHCFFVKADNERAKLGDNNVNFFDEENDDVDDGEQPEWVDLVQPCADFHFESEFKYDDGGAHYDWSSIQCQYPDNLVVNCLDNLKNTEEDLENNSLLSVAKRHTSFHLK
jgi:hypothetical protein